MAQLEVVGTLEAVLRQKGAMRAASLGLAPTAAVGEAPFH